MGSYTINTLAKSLHLTYRQVLELDAETVLNTLHLDQAKQAYQRRLQSLLNPKTH